MWTEVSNGVGAVNFLTGAGGFLQALLFGYAGLRIFPGYMTITPRAQLPPGSERLKVQGLNYLASEFDLIISLTSIEFQCQSEQPLKLEAILLNEAGIDDWVLCQDGPGSRLSFLKADIGEIRLSSVSNEVEKCEAPKDEILVDYGKII